MSELVTRAEGIGECRNPLVSDTLVSDTLVSGEHPVRN